MLGKPFTHFLIRPSPVKRMSIELVIFWPSGFYMINECVTAGPGTAFQVAMAEGIVEQFALIEPRSMHRSESGSPLRMRLEIRAGGRCGMAGITILDQKRPA